MLTQKEHNERMTLYKQGLSDKKIGERLFLTYGAIASWRQKLGLPGNMRKQKADKKRMEERMKLYEQGLSDKEIADKQGYSRVSIASWRRSKNLPNVNSKKWRKER